MFSKGGCRQTLSGSAALIVVIAKIHWTRVVSVKRPLVAKTGDDCVVPPLTLCFKHVSAHIEESWIAVLERMNRFWYWLALLPVSVILL